MKGINLKEAINLLGSIFSITGVTLLWLEQRLDTKVILMIIIKSLVFLSLSLLLYGLSEKILEKIDNTLRKEYVISLKILRVAVLLFLIYLFIYHTVMDK